MRKLFLVFSLLVVVAVMAVPAFAQDQRPTVAQLLADDADGRFTTLLAAIDAAGLGDAIADLDGATVLAPTNDAFVASLTSLGLSPADVLANPDLLTQILNYHILPGKYFFRNLTSGPAIATLQGEEVQFDLTSGAFTVNGVSISDVDNIAANGVVQVIDGVLVPPGVLAALQAPAEAPAGVAAAKPGIAETLASDADGRFTTLLAAINAAGLGDELANLDGATLLAPTNDAFTASLTTLGLSPADVLANPDLLTQILNYHILPGKYFFRNLTSGPAIATLQGEEVQFDLTDGAFTVNGVSVSDIDNVAGNGVIQVIDGVLVPPSVLAALQAPAEVPAGVAAARPGIAEMLASDADGRFTTLLAAINAAGLGDELANLDGATLLAPTNDAFTASLTALGVSPASVLANPDLLTQILNYHILPGKYFFRNLTSGPAIATLQGEEVQFDLTDGAFTVNGVGISDIDNVAGNGVIQVIDGVLVPPSVLAALQPQVEATPAPEVTPPVVATRPTILEWLRNDADGRFSTLLTAIDAAGLGPAFEGLNHATLLAPTNDAFASTLAFLGVSPDAEPDPVLLAQILRTHIIPGEYFFRNLTSGPSLGTLAGSNVQFNLNRGALTVNNVGVSDIDNVAANGVIQVIDGLLLPRSAANTFPAQLRFANVAADAPDVDVFVNFRPVVTGVPFNTFSEWMTLPAGTYNIAVVPTGRAIDEALIGPEDVVLGAHTWTTIAANGSMMGGTLALQVIPEDYSALAGGQARLTVYHAVEGAPAVNINANGSVIVTNLAYPGTNGDNDGVYTLNLPAGTYTVTITAFGGPETILDLGTVTLDAGTHTFLAMTGTPSNPGVTLAVAEVPAQ